MSERCHCGRPLHYSDPMIEAMVRDMVARLGPYLVVTVAGETITAEDAWADRREHGDVARSYLVPRHYIALHGLKAVEIARLGFAPVDRRRSDVVHDVDGAPVITCLRCGRTSHHRHDVEQRYCGSCRAFHEDR